MVNAVETEIIIPGPASVSEFQSNLPMYSAHRGGSADWPEHSLRAYTQAAYRGYGCLEVSIQRTSDGVFVCNHDPSINAVVWGGISGLPDISAMTWDQLSTYMIKAPENHLERDPEPFIRLTDLLGVYGDSHVFMIDPKNISSAFYTDILDLLDAWGGNQRFIGKWVGSNLTWSNALKARSYESWGAFYGSNWVTGGAGFDPEWADQWSMLGLNYDSDQAHWDEIIAAAAGKPVLAHVCPDQASVDMGASKGASGFQVSGIESVYPLPPSDVVDENAPLTYNDLPAGMIVIAEHDGTNWPARPTSRTDLIVQWVGPDTVPAGMLSNDLRLVVAA